MPSDDRYWDSCCFIDRIQRTPGRIDVLEGITDAAEKGELFIFTSALTFAEVLYLSNSSDPLPDQIRTIEEYFENPFIIVRSVDRQIGIRAADIARRFNLKQADAIHVATALFHGVPILETYDANHILPLNGQIAGLTIQRPQPIKPQPLFPAP